jgi:hypothetical protein
MAKELREFVDSCPTCALRGAYGGKIPGLLGLRPECAKAEEIALDYCHLTEAVYDGVRYQGVLGIIDRASRFVRWIPCTKEFTTKDIISLCLRHWISVFGFPSTIRSDNEPKLDSNLWGRFWAGAGCMVSHSIAYHPRGNGIIERSFRTLQMRLRAMLWDIKDCNWVEMLPFLEGFHNATPRDSLAGLCPAEVMMGYAPRWDNLPFTVPCRQTESWLDTNSKMIKTNEGLAREAMMRYNARMKEDVDKKRKVWRVKVGDLVLVRRDRFPNFVANKTFNPYIGPLEVKEVLGNHNVKVIWEGKEYESSVNALVQFKGNAKDRDSAPMQKLIQSLSSGEVDGLLPSQGLWDVPYPSTDEEREEEEAKPRTYADPALNQGIKPPVKLSAPSFAKTPVPKMSKILEQSNLNPYARTVPEDSLPEATVRTIPYIPPPR